MSAFEIAFNAVVPIFLMIILGFFAKKMGILSQEFVNQSSKLVFRICLPAMVFSKVASINLSLGFEASQIYLMLFCIFGTIGAYIISKYLAKILLKQSTNSRGYATGAFIQGAFRSNYMIIGYPVLINLFGDEVVVNMALVTLVVMPCYNIISIIALTPPNQHNSIKKYSSIVVSVIKNPIIIGIALGFVSAFLDIQVPKVLNSFINMAANLATPLALVAIGAFFHFDDFKDTLGDTVKAIGLKLIFFPVLMTIIAFLLGFSPMNIILIGVLFGGPTAVSSFAMSNEMGGDAVLSGNIIILSSLLCLVSYMMILTVWLSVLSLA